MHQLFICNSFFLICLLTLSKLCSNFSFQTAWSRFGAFSRSLRKPWPLWWRYSATRHPDSWRWLITNCAPLSMSHPLLHITLSFLKPLKKVRNKILCIIVYSKALHWLNVCYTCRKSQKEPSGSTSRSFSPVSVALCGQEYFPWWGC